MTTKKPQPLDLIQTGKNFLEDFAKEILKEVKKELNEKYPQKEIVAHAKIYTFIRKLVDDIKQCLKSACEFYLRYKDKPMKLMLDFKYNDFAKIVSKKFYPLKNSKQKELYNEWLFKLAFKDVIGK